MHGQSISVMLLACSVTLLIPTPSETRGGIGQNKEILSWKEREVLGRLEGMAWQAELTEEDREFLRRMLLGKDPYEKRTLLGKAIVAAAVHEDKELVPALLGQEGPMTKAAIQEEIEKRQQRWGFYRRLAVAEAIHEGRPVADALVEGLRSLEGRPRPEGDRIVEVVAIIEIKKLRAGASAGSRLQGLPLSDRDRLLVEVASLPVGEAVDTLLARFEQSERPGEWRNSLEALETYGDTYFSRLPELIRPSALERLGGKKSRSLLGSILLSGLPRIEPTTRARLKSVLALPLERTASEIQQMDDAKQLRGMLLEAIEKRDGSEGDS